MTIGESNQDLHYKKVFINFFLHGERNFQCSDTQTTDHSNNRTQWNKILSEEVLMLKLIMHQHFHEIFVQYLCYIKWMEIFVKKLVHKNHMLCYLRNNFNPLCKTICGSTGLIRSDRGKRPQTIHG